MKKDKFAKHSVIKDGEVMIILRIIKKLKIPSNILISSLLTRKLIIIK